MEKITTNTKSLELTGEETHVHFTTAFPYFWLRNDSGGTVLMSLPPNIEEGGDGVIEVLAGNSVGTMHGFNCTRNDLYLSGSGKVQVMGTHSPEPPFRNAGIGGDDSGGSDTALSVFTMTKLGAIYGTSNNDTSRIVVETPTIFQPAVIVINVPNAPYFGAWFVHPLSEPNIKPIYDNDTSPYTVTYEAPNLFTVQTSMSLSSDVYRIDINLL